MITYLVLVRLSSAQPRNPLLLPPSPVGMDCGVHAAVWIVGERCRRLGCRWRCRWSCRRGRRLVPDRSRHRGLQEPCEFLAKTRPAAGLTAAGRSRAILRKPNALPARPHRGASRFVSLWYKESVNIRIRGNLTTQMHVFPTLQNLKYADSLKHTDSSRES